MINALKIVLLLALLLPAPVSAQAEGKLLVRFSGMASTEGLLAAALWTSAETFLSRQQSPARSFNGPISLPVTVWEIDNLAFGDYAISVYHDRTRNGKLDSGLFGIPQEDYGFSNNARGSFGPPAYQKARFIYNETNQVIEIQLR